MIVLRSATLDIFKTGNLFRTSNFNVLPPDDSNPNRLLPFPRPDFPPLRLIGNPTHRTTPLAGVYAHESIIMINPLAGMGLTDDQYNLITLT